MGGPKPAGSAPDANVTPPSKTKIDLAAHSKNLPVVGYDVRSLKLPFKPESPKVARTADSLVRATSLATKDDLNFSMRLPKYCSRRRESALTKSAPVSDERIFRIALVSFTKRMFSM